MSFSSIQSAGDAIDITREYLFARTKRQGLLLAFMAIFLGPTGVSGPPGPVDINEEAFDPGPDLPSLGEVLDAIDWELALLVVVAVAFLAVVYGLISAVMEFGFVHSLTSDTVELRRPARDHWSRILSLFLFRALVWGSIATGVVVMIAVGLGLFEAPVALDSLVLAVLVFIGGGVLYLLNRLTTDFVVPIMYSERRGFLSSWARLLGLMRREWRQYGAYIPVRIILEIALGIAFGIVLAITLVAMGIIIGVPLVAVLVVILGLLPAVVITGVVLGILGLGFIAVLMVPFHTYLRYYTLLVLGDTSESLDLIPNKRHRVRFEN